MAKARIMIVEDESIVVIDLKATLRDLGYEIAAVASTGEKAILKAGETRPDLVLMDIRLKGEMDGIQAAEQIKDRFDTPVIYLTAYADEATLQRAKVTTPYGYLLKPFEDRELHSTIEMALYRQKMEMELKETKAWLATTLKSIGDAVIATDTEGRITFMNPVAEALTGWKQTDVLGRAVSDIFHIINEKTHLTTVCPVETAIKTEAVVFLEDHTLLVDKNGKETPIDDSAAPIKDDSGNIIGGVLVFRDVTERRNAEEKLRRYARQLQLHNTELDAFAHTVAHDLKSPLAPLVGLSEAIQEDLETVPLETLREFLQAIVRSGRKMDNIIEELMLLAGVRKATVPRSTLQMDFIVNEARERLDYIIREAGAKLITPEEWPVAVGYGPWVEEIWANYISNAVKYGGQPPIIELGATPLQNGSIKFWVKDNGTGLTPEAQAKLFVPFEQLNRVRATGHGLGLSIVQRIAQKLGGQAMVESQPNFGSCFSFTLPATSAATAQRVTAPLIVGIRDYTAKD